MLVIGSSVKISRPATSFAIHCEESQSASHYPRGFQAIEHNSDMRIREV